MSGYIDVDLYIEYLTELKKSAEKHFRYEEAVQLGLEINRIKDFPTVSNVHEVKHGKNITENNLVDEFICSECGIIFKDISEYDVAEDIYREFIFKYCPNCGAKMDKE